MFELNMGEKFFFKIMGGFHSTKNFRTLKRGEG